jgi:hypothetical protein
VNCMSHKIIFFTDVRINVMNSKNVGPGWLSRYRDSLRTGRSEDRIPVAARFSAPVNFRV